MRQAKIKCPHCGESITVRQTDGVRPMTEAEAKKFDEAWDEIDKMFDGVSSAMTKLFRAIRFK